MHKIVRGAFFNGQVFVDAAAGINGQHNGKRHVGLLFKDGNFLRMAVLGDGEIVFGESANRRAVGIRYIDEDIDQAHVYADGRDVLRAQSRPQKKQRDDGQRLHDTTGPRSSSGNGSPSAQTTPSSKCSFFQTGTVFLSVSMSQRQASKAAGRCAEATAISTLVSPTSSLPRRWTSNTSRTGKRVSASCARDCICLSAISS